MYLKKVEGPLFVVLPNGERMSRGDLPPAGTTRWVASRKAKVAKAVLAGLMTGAEACARWGLSEEELAEWIGAYRRHGTRALRATALKRYRQGGGAAGKVGE